MLICFFFDYQIILARLNVNRNNPRRKQNRHSYHHHNRNQLDDVKNSDRNSSSSSTSETDINQAQETDHSVDVVETNLSDLSLNDPSYMVCHIEYILLI